MFELAEIRAATQRDGDGWALSHAERVLGLALKLMPDADYDCEALAYAAYLHDWAALAGWGSVGRDHAARSAEIARDIILPQTGLSLARQERIVQAIAYHDYRDERDAPSIEALLLREADMLDMLGPLGLARECTWGPRDLAVVVLRVRSKQALILERLTLQASRAIGERRAAQAARWVEEIEADLGG